MALTTVPVQTRLVLMPTPELNVGLPKVRKSTPFVCNVAVTLGLAPKLPLVRVIKLVMLMRPPAGRTNGALNAGVWVNVVTLVPGPVTLIPAAAGLMDTAISAQAWDVEFVHLFVTLLPVAT